MLWWIPSPLAGWPALRLGAAGLANLGLLAAQLLLLDPIPRSERPDFCVAHTVQDFVQVLCQEESMCVWGGGGGGQEGEVAAQHIPPFSVPSV